MPFHRKFAIGKVDIISIRLHNVCGNFARFGGDFVEGANNRLTADSQGAGAIGAHAKGDFGGVAMHNINAVVGDAQLVRHQLRKGCFVPLSVTVAAGEDRHRTGGIYPHIGGFE